MSVLRDTGIKLMYLYKYQIGKKVGDLLIELADQTQLKETSCTKLCGISGQLAAGYRIQAQQINPDKGTTMQV